jgi:cyclopropane-fatty-acyl-phospholipid synthase
MEKGLARLAAPARKIFHRMRANTRTGSRLNIAAHYDLGNDFFSRFLDDTMTYSCGYFVDPGTMLHDASIEKYDRICRKIDLRPSHEILEIGCGWGGFAVHAAREYGCRVVATTISENQYEWARKRVREEGLADRVEILHLDYRDLPGRLDRRFDRIVSIEMIEAVGRRYLGTFFETCDRLLTPDGLMSLQSITIADQNYRDYSRSVDFIQRYIFPGGFLPSVTSMNDAITRSTEMRVVDLEDIGPHYARTLRLWYENFLGNIESIRNLGYPEEFLRLWEFYFCYCEGAFLERAISDVQMVLAGPDWRGATRAREV